MTNSPRQLRTTFATITVLGLMVFGALAAGSDDLHADSGGSVARRGERQRSLQARGATRQGARVQRVRRRRRHSGRCQATPRLGQVEADHAAVSVVNGSLLCLAIARAFVAGAT